MLANKSVEIGWERSKENPLLLGEVWRGNTMLPEFRKIRSVG
jgi:hypothetical protein